MNWRLPGLQFPRASQNKTRVMGHGLIGYSELPKLRRANGPILNGESRECNKVRCDCERLLYRTHRQLAAALSGEIYCIAQCAWTRGFPGWRSRAVADRTNMGDRR